ncbi:hypothetical protein NDU88_011534 [Pleurodeles waltl]|uniref:WAP domain-containing protein n=1 Tax=Pleurodeles waltl TaxID=8319 RepID=A0AAV7S4J0_PLEWA|nr:hypothetical protein NDU88_011534 [Pleurodeles waltl]
MQCVKALAEKPGTCPHADITCSEVFDEPQCQSDSDCPPTKRCCNKCGNKCLDAVQDHTGFCPTSPFLMLFVCVPNITKSSCSGDSQCQATEKCCSFNCKTQCTEASKEKWGACPKIGRNQTEVELLRDVCNKCNDDRDCPDVQKCCPGTEGRVCIKPGNLFVRPAIDAGSSGAE